MTAVFTPDELALLSELIEAGVQLSGDRLAKLSGTPWKALSASVEVVPIVRALTVFHNEKSRHIGARMRSQSLLPLEFIMLFPEASAERVAGMIAKATSVKKPRSMPLNSVIGEVANILGQGIVKELADRFGISIILSVPQVSAGGEAGLAAGVLNKFDGRKDAVVLVRIEMHTDDVSAACSMLLLLDIDVLKRLLAKALVGGS
jgi:chemotaxis protein CheY-P-specific phosphatase CheC